MGYCNVDTCSSVIHSLNKKTPNNQCTKHGRYHGEHTDVVSKCDKLHDRQSLGVLRGYSRVHTVPIGVTNS